MFLEELLPTKADFMTLVMLYDLLCLLECLQFWSLPCRCCASVNIVQLRAQCWKRFSLEVVFCLGNSQQSENLTHLTLGTVSLKAPQTVLNPKSQFLVDVTALDTLRIRTAIAVCSSAHIWDWGSREDSGFALSHDNVSVWGKQNHSEQEQYLFF